MLYESSLGDVMRVVDAWDVGLKGDLRIDLLLDLEWSLSGVA